MTPVDPAARVVVTRSVIHRNTIVDNGASGVFLNQGSVGNLLLANTSSRILPNGATGTTVLGNILTENQEIDARDTMPDQKSSSCDRTCPTWWPCRPDNRTWRDTGRSGCAAWSRRRCGCGPAG